MKVTRTHNSIIIHKNVVKSCQNNPRTKPDLKQIVEVTQQYESNTPPNLPEPPKNQTAEEQHSPSQTYGRFRRFLTCLSNIWRYVYTPKDRLEITIDDTEFSRAITRLKTKTNHYKPILPPQKEQKKVLVLDLDETLIHTTFKKPDSYDFESQVMLSGFMNKIYTKKRFGLQAFLFEMSKLYEIILFTASQRRYADNMIDQIDPKGRISHRLYRQHCIVLNKSSFLKNLNLLGRNLQETIIVDDSNIAGILHPQNFYKIQPFQGKQKDRHLCRLSAFLKHIHQKSQILPIKHQRKLFEEMEIKVQEQAIGETKFSHSSQKYTINQRGRANNHQATNSDTLFLDNSQTSTEAQTTASDLMKKY